MFLRGFYEICSWIMNFSDSSKGGVGSTALQGKIVFRFSEEQYMKIEQFKHSGLLLTMCYVVQ